MAGDLNTHDQVVGLFTNFTWTKENLSVEEMNIVKHWSTSYTDVFSGLLSFVLVTVRRRLLFLHNYSVVIIFKYHYTNKYNYKNREEWKKRTSVSVHLFHHKFDSAGTIWNFYPSI